jgi:phytoene synthase
MLNDLKTGTSTDHVGRALVDTVNRFDIPIAYFEAFLHSMAMDLDVVEYANFDALSEYVYGSAAVIGLQMVEILGMKKGEEENTRKAAEKLGIAFQLANFIRDVGEDLERGRIYLPMDELAAFNIDREMLERKIVTPQLKLALKDQIERVRKLQSEANAGIKNLSPDSRPCIEAASELYCGIVDEVEKIDFQIFNKRAKTSTLRRIRVALPAWLRAVKAR